MRVALALGLVLVPIASFGPQAQAGIEPRREDGRIVFTSRPERKPGAQIPQHPRRAAEGTPGTLQRLIRDVSDRYRIDPWLVSAVISVESDFDSEAISPKGAKGLMQLMPTTAREYGVRDVYDPLQNVEGGVAYLADLTKRYGGNLKLALAAYNAGPMAVDRAGGVPAYPETVRYLEKIEARYGQSLGEALFSAGRFGRGRIRASVDENGHVFATNRPGRRAGEGTSLR